MNLKEFPIKFNYMEFGFLLASISKELWERMPRSLWLKLKIHATKAYLNHPTFGRQAKKDIERWEKELKIIHKSYGKITK